MRDRKGGRLDTWLEKVAQSPLKDLHPVAYGIRLDLEAVEAGLILPWSNDYVACCTSLLESRSKHFSRPLLTLLKRRKETRPPVIVAHPNNAPLAPRTIYKYIEAGRLTAHKPGPYLLLRGEDLRHLLEAGVKGRRNTESAVRSRIEITYSPLLPGVQLQAFNTLRDA